MDPFKIDEIRQALCEMSVLQRDLYQYTDRLFSEADPEAPLRRLKSRIRLDMPGFEVYWVEELKMFVLLPLDIEDEETTQTLPQGSV